MDDAGRYFDDEAARPRPYAGQLTEDFQAALARLHGGFAETACYFTHNLRLPSGRMIDGALHLRGGEETYIGNVPLYAKRVLEYLPGSGGLSAFLAARGGAVVALDQAPGLLPAAARGLAEQIRRGWWFAKAALGFAAQAVYADLYAPPGDLGRFDVAILPGLFAQLQHPFLALQRAAEMADTLVVVEPVLPEDTQGSEMAPPVARFIHTLGEDTPARWQHTPSAIMLMLASTGFTELVIGTHAPRTATGLALPHLTIVAKRSAGPLQITAAAPAMPSATADELPLPDAAGRVNAAGTDDVETFAVFGHAGFAALQASLARAGTTAASLGRILDFGCGVGRVLRYWHGQPDVELHGTDLNPESIAWCAHNLTFAQFKTNWLAPALDYPDGYFGFVYALSVFTHLPEELQLPWLRELIRVTRPGGLLYLTTHGDAYRQALSAELQAQYDRGELAVSGAERPGSNYCGAYHPPAYVRDRLLAASGLELIEFLPEGAAGNPTQDSWLLRTPP